MRVIIPYRGCKEVLYAILVFLLFFGWSGLEEDVGGLPTFLWHKVVRAEETKELQRDAGIIQGIHFTEGERESSITICGSKQLTYTVVRLNNPLRIVVDVPGFISNGAITPIEVKSQLVSEINGRVVGEGVQQLFRVEIGLKKNVEYEVNPDGNDLIIRLSQAEADANLLREEPGERVGEELLKGFKQREITDVHLKEKGDGLVIISDSEIGKYTSFVLEDPPRLVVDVLDMRYSATPDLSRLKSLSVEGVRVGIHTDKVRFVINFRDRVPAYTVGKEGKMLQVDWAVTSGGKLKGQPVIAAEPANEGIEEKLKEVSGDLQESSLLAGGEGVSGEKKIYTGQKISLDFKDADIRNILRLIADVSGLNIIVSENVKGKITVKLENVPWDQVLDIVLETNNLGKVWMGDVLRIETQAEIKRISDEKYNAQKSRERVAELVTEVVDVIYRDAKDVADLLTKEKEITSERGAISVDPNLNRIVITDTPEKIEKVKEKIARYDDTTVRQVYIEAKIVQSIPTFTKEIGIQWGGPYVATGHGGKEVYGVGGAGGVTFEKEEVTDPLTGLTTEVLKKVVSNGKMIDLPAAAGPGVGGGIGFGILRRNLELTATLTAMEKQEKLKIISNPRVLSIDKNEAVIKQGVALPYLKLSEEGVTSTEFKDAVLELKVTPTILSPKIIKVEIKVKKDQKSAQTGAGGEPGIDVREAQTVLMVESGRTVVIGGIYEETATTIRSGVPFFSDLPAFGRFFRNDYNKKELTELLIFLTTTIVPKEIIGADV